MYKTPNEDLLLLLNRRPSREPRKSFSMRWISLFCLLLLSIVLVKAYLIKTCKYWCKMGNHRYYCCPNGKGDSWAEHDWHSFFFPWFSLGTDDSFAESPWQEFLTKWRPKKHCPPLRAHCPRTYAEWYKPPEFCDSDHDCDEWEKCCYDVCLGHKTCKDPE